MNGPLAFVCGLVFALGLGLSGMTQPSKVVGFLDLAGSWDPSLALVMGGALAVFAPVYRWSRRRRTPLFAAHFIDSTERQIDARLVGGAVLFGIGWGLSGFCPGPAIVSLGAASRGAFVFVPAMLAGMVLHAFLDARLAPAHAPPSPESTCG